MSKQLLVTGPSRKGWHRLQTFLECPQKFAWKYPREAGSADRSNTQDWIHRQGTSLPSPPLIRGSLIHLGLAHHYARMKAKHEGKDPEDFYTPQEAVRVYGSQQGWDLYVEPMVACVEAYMDHFCRENLRIVEVETPHTVTFLDGNDITGRLDLVVEDRAGRIYVIDHKTTVSYSDSQRTYYSMSGQFMAYTWLGIATWGDRFAGMKINFIQHTEPYKFIRVDTLPAPALLRKLPTTIAHAERQIRFLREMYPDVNDWPTANSELTCVHRYGECEFIRQCRFGRDEALTFSIGNA